MPILTTFLLARLRSTGSKIFLGGGIRLSAPSLSALLNSFFNNFMFLFFFDISFILKYYTNIQKSAQIESVELDEFFQIDRTL